jgi:hypothetical protein
MERSLIGDYLSFFFLIKIMRSQHKLSRRTIDAEFVNATGGTTTNKPQTNNQTLEM